MNRAIDRLLPLVSCLLLLVACGGMEQPTRESVEESTPTGSARFRADALSALDGGASEGTPTLSPHFAGVRLQAEPSSDGTPTLSSHVAGAASPSATSPPEGTPTATSHLSQTQVTTPTPHPVAPPSTPSPLPEGSMAGNAPFALAQIYTDTLAAGWSVAESWGVQLDLTNTTFVQSGDRAIAVTPAEDYGSLFFAVTPGSPHAYPYERTLGARFWLNAGAEPLHLDQLAVTVLGSNAYPHWEEDDDSVEIEEGETFFSETRLYYLELNRVIPAETWTEIVIWLDDLPFDPDYTYVTGLCVKSEAGLRQTFYVDDVGLIVMER